MTKNILYRASNLTDWIDVAKKLQREHSWDPVYWISHPDLAPDISAAFPESTFHSKWDARRNIPPDGEGKRDTPPLDKDILEQFRPYRFTILRLMTRMDPGHAYSYDEMVRSYHKLLRYWLYTIEKYSIDGVVFSRIPHGVDGYVIYAICREKGIPTPMFKPVHAIPKMSLSQDTVQGTNRQLEHLCSEKLQELDPDKVSNPSKKSLERLVGEYEKPQYMTDENKHPYLSKIKNFSNYPSYLKKITGKAGTHDKVRSKTIESSEMSLMRKILQRQIAKIKKRQLRKSYNNISLQPDLSSPYIYVPLHYQPERTTVPDGHVFGNQLLMIDLLSKTIPKDWMLFVKEHPSQFSSDSKGERGRHTYDYKDINTLDNTVLVDIESDSFELIDNAETTATVTGTAGWESVVRGKPCIIFGNAWYRPCPGVHYVTTKKEVKDAIQNIQQSSDIQRDNVLRFIRAVEIAGCQSYQSANWSDSDLISTDVNSQNIASEIAKHIC